MVCCYHGNFQIEEFLEESMGHLGWGVGHFVVAAAV